ncbi:DNA (cytosine-5-)-methyltransferase [Psittacicella hinzii]|uniref:Cytosine-specific methyltransferase n=1 Tax=Psittacicella hinzii TaxID=2028575 RepID=A0A3A1Y8Z3_9GAMM|nr:DNA (cytosine-5-)-methyltransferase [Psittacicella hinzii]RIY34773.1 DNA (cytosine-5-)-methyltransferase [Psittacicella hinzii]
MKTINFIDLFAGMGGFRLGFKQAAQERGIKAECVFSSEIKPYAVQVYQSNFNQEIVHGDITQIPSASIPDFDVLLGGFPCQAFSNAGKRQGFADTRGTLFFEVERILRDKKPQAFILENVEGLVKHDLQDKTDKIGRTLSIILTNLASLGYQVSWQILDASNFGIPQSRKRIFLVGTRKTKVDLTNFKYTTSKLADVLETGKATLQSEFIHSLLSKYSLPELYGKSVKDKRGGANNIHSWDLELKGSVSPKQADLLKQIMKARRNKKWAALKGIQWMSGMPLTTSEIRTFFDDPDLESMLEDLCTKKYLKLEHPKDLVVYTNSQGKQVSKREYRTDLEKGYNIVTGKLSFEINKILDPKDITPTLVATDLDRIVVPDNNGLRLLTTVEQKRLFGFPDDYVMEVKPKEIFDLFGNTVAVPVVKAVAIKLLDTL